MVSPQANLKARGLQILPVPKMLLCWNNSHLSRATPSPQSMHSNKRIICRCFLPVTESWWAGHLLNGFETWSAWLCQHPQGICSSAEYPPNLLEICAFQTGLPKDPYQPELWQHCCAQDHLPAFLSCSSSWLVCFAVRIIVVKVLCITSIINSPYEVSPSHTFLCKSRNQGMHEAG